MCLCTGSFGFCFIDFPHFQSNLAQQIFLPHSLSKIILNIFSTDILSHILHSILGSNNPRLIFYICIKIYTKVYSSCCKVLPLLTKGLCHVFPFILLIIVSWLCASFTQSSQLLATTDPFVYFCLFLGACNWNHIVLVFSDWPLSSSNVYLRFIHIFPRFNSSFLFIME